MTTIRRLATASLMLLASVDPACFVRAETASASAGKLRSLGEQAMAEQRFDDAVSFYGQVIKMEPDNASNYYRLYRVHNRMRNFVSALKDITQACEVDPKQAEYRFHKAKLLVNLGRCDDAVVQYKTIQSQGSNTSGVGVEEFKAAFIEAHECDDQVKAAHQAFAKENYRDAKTFVNMALAHMEQAPDLLFMKSQCLYHLGDYFGVVSDTGKILKVHSQNIEAYQLRGEAYFRIGDHDVAVQHFREGLKLDPEHKGCKAGHKLVKSIVKKEQRGDDAKKAGKHKEAIDYWFQAIKIDETHRAFVRPTLLKIITASTAIGDHVNAINLAEAHVEEEETLEGIFALGDALTGGEKFQEAVNIFEKAMEFEVSLDRSEWFLLSVYMNRSFPTCQQ